jgi:hypothetical protein
MPLPKIVDFDVADVVTLTVNFGDAVNFLKLNGVTSINCDDLNENGSSNIRNGLFPIIFTLDDKRDKV